MSEGLAVEWARYSIHVNCIAPGAFNSEIMHGFSRTGEFAHHFPRRRMGDASQLDSTILYLSSPVSEFVAGSTIFVYDGQGTR